MGEEQTDPLEIIKEPQIVKAAQAELSKIDVLVCGECHEVFHFIEQFQEHRSSDKCTKESSLLESCQSESKSQLWSFMLWKNAKFKNSADEDSTPSSWNVYQLWCNLEQIQKDAWLAAGKSLQNVNTICSAKLLIPSKSVNKPVKARITGKFKKGDEEESLEEGEIKLQKKPSKTFSDSKLDSEQDPLADTETDLDTEEELEKVKSTAEKCENGNIKNTLLKPVQLNSDITIIPSAKKPLIKKAIRTNVDDKKTEYVVEKIVAKRYNPGKKTHEYLIKWENFDDDQNTWEPVFHLESCKALVEEFDRNLQKAKAQKLTKPPLVQRRVYKKNIVPVDKNEDIILTPGGRPQRTSKQKALNQVKVWCGNISDADEGSGKRPYSDSDSDSFEKKFRLDADSSDSEDDRPPITVKRILKTPVNGVGKKQPLPENILVPDAQGVVRINQKQLPALSSGVYVMSKTAGIIRLDSNASKIATSGGHAVIKLAPKIGQTSIKVIRKDLPTNGSKPTIISQAGKLRQVQKPVTAKVIAHRNRIVSAILRKPEQSMDQSKSIDEDSDGLEELPFPTDLPLPQPDSPPGDFTLCPLTGKILGQNNENQEEKDVVTVKQELITEINSAVDNVNIDNLAKLTAAEILNESPAVKTEKEEKDSANVAERIDMEISAEVKDCKRAEMEQTQSIEEALSAMEADTPVTTTPSITTISTKSTSSSILSTALSNANIESGTISVSVTTSTSTTTSTPVTTVTKKLLNTTEAIRQKTAMNRSIINRTIIPKPAPQAIITRITPGSTLKQRQMINKPKFGVPPPTTFRKAIRQTYGNRNSSLVRKIGSTAVFSSVSSSMSATSTKEKSPAVLDVNTTTESLVQTLTDNSPSAVINMPLLTEIESASTSSTDVANVEPEADPPVTPTGIENVNTDLNAAISLNDTDTPLLITGEDGTIYQVAGQNEDGQTILIAQDADGQQQCLLVASESSTDLAEPTTATATTVNAAPITNDISQQVEEPLVADTEPEPENENSEDSQIVAQIVSAQPPSPGGTRKVVLMLPDGNLMMTEVTAEQYAALELDK